MSVVIAIVDGQRVHLGADSRDSGPGYCDESPTEKVSVEKLSDGTQVGLGFTGCPRVSQVARYCVDWSTIDPPKDDPMRWLVAGLIPRLRSALSEHEAPRDEDHPGTMDGNMLVAMKGRIFGIHVCWQVYERHDFTVIGVDEAARGAIFAMRQLGATPEQIMPVALAAAARWSPQVAPPFRFWTVH